MILLMATPAQQLELTNTVVCPKHGQRYYNTERSTLFQYDALLGRWFEVQDKGEDNENQ